MISKNDRLEKLTNLANVYFLIVSLFFSYRIRRYGIYTSKEITNDQLYSNVHRHFEREVVSRISYTF